MKKNKLSKIWFPLAVVAFATAQTFGMDISRNSWLWADSPSCAADPVPEPDTVIYENKIYTKFRDINNAIVDSLGGDDLLDDIAEDTVILARDTIKAPDSLKLTDPFRYQYYAALVDSLTHVFVRDSLRNAGDTLIWPKIDSIYFADSIVAAKKAFEIWYAGLDKQAKKRYDFEQKMNLKQKQMDSTFKVQDSLKAIKDSIKVNTPRILETYAVPDSMFYKRIITWTKDSKFNTINLKQLDTSYNFWFYDYPIYRKDVGTSYLGIIGSPAQTYDFFKRESVEGFSFYDPLEVYSYSPSTLPMFNTKTPYTELAYWGTLFANADNEEADIHILTTQNFTPSTNFTVGYDRVGANGILQKEDVDNRTLHSAINHLGKRYSAHLGYIYNKMGKNENGGIVDNSLILDTLIGGREIPVHLNNASNLIKKNTVFLDQTYKIPFSFLKKIGKGKAAAEGDADAEDAEDVEEADIAEGNDVTTAFIGHSSEYTVIRKVYKDDIPLSNTIGREYYNNQFYINPTLSSDSLRVMKLENKVFVRLQPWSQDAIVSTVNAGIGNRVLNYFMMTPTSYLTPDNTNTVWNSTYLYGGIGGLYKKYVNWGAEGYYTFLGDEINDVGLKADASFSFYPFRKAKNSPVTVRGKFETSLDEPEFYTQHYFSNHYKWENDFGKISTTKIEGEITVPYWNLSIRGGYALLSNNIYYDTLGIVKQNITPMSVAKLEVQKNFKASLFHFDNSALFQLSSNSDVMPLPTAALNLRWYLQLDVVKNVMQMQIGVNGTYTTKWYAPGYSPALGMFHNQNKFQYGNCPYFDAFVNLQWKRACIFVKYVNAGMGWPMESTDYFSAHGYIRPQNALKFGIFWPFYRQTKKLETMSSKMSSGSSKN